MRYTLALACAAIIGLTALAERAQALAVVDVFHYLDLRQNPNGTLDPRLSMFIDLRDIDGAITSRTVDVDGPAPFDGVTFPMISFGPALEFGSGDPVLRDGRIWRTFDDDLTPLAQATFTMSVSDASETVTGVARPLIGPGETAEFLPLVSNVTTSGDPFAPTISWTNPTDMSGVDLIRIRIIDTDSVTFSTEIYEAVITDLSTTSITIDPGILIAGDFQLRVQLEDQETVTDVLNGVERSSFRTVSRSTNINDLAVVPLPGSVYMLLSALAVFGWLGRKRLLAKRG